MMRNVFFNDPYSADCIERLKFLYLYFDGIEVIDYSRLLAKVTFDSLAEDMESSLDAHFSDAMDKQGIRDRNQRARAGIKAKPLRRKIQSVMLRHVRKFLDEQHAYWEYLVKLGKEGIIVIDNTSIDPDANVRSKLGLGHVSDNEARDTAKIIGDSCGRWAIRFLMAELTRNDADRDLLWLLLAAIGPIFATYMLGAIVKQNQGSEVYTGENEQLEAISLLQKEVPAHVKLAEMIFRIDVPNLQYLDIEQVIKVKESLRSERLRFHSEMESVTNDLRRHQWDDKLLAELRGRKTQQIDPALSTLREQTKFAVSRAIGTRIEQPVQSAVTGVTLAISLNFPIGATLLLGALGTALGLSTSLVADLHAREAKLQENGLGYIIRLARRI